jgi:hypothetical protein
MGNNSTTWPIVLTSVWCRHADVEGISPASSGTDTDEKQVMGWMENATASRYCRADVKWINGYALRPHHKLSKAHQYPA